MANLILCDYIGNSNGSQPIGHPVKVLKELSDCFLDSGQIVEPKFICPKNYRGFFNREFIELPFSYDVSNFKRSYRIKSFFRRLKNIKKALRQTGPNDSIWFINVDIVLFFYLMLHGAKRKNIALTLYRNDFGTSSFKQRVKTRIMRRGLKKVRFVFKTAKDLNFSIPNIFIPDYIYSEEAYPKIKKVKDRVVCLGTMNEGKDLEGLVGLFNKNGRPLLIAGYFYDGARYERLRQAAKPNIEIQNKYLTREEYLQYLGSAEYCIVPYLAKEYDQRTSGVLLDSVFMHTAIIAPRGLLEFNHISGVAYERIEDINLDMVSAIPSNDEILVEYEKKNVQKNILSAVASFMLNGQATGH